MAMSSVIDNDDKNYKRIIELEMSYIAKKKMLKFEVKDFPIKDLKKKKNF